MADFAYSPDFNYRVQSRYNVETSKFENMVEEARLLTSKKLRLFELTFKNRDKTERDAAIAFFDTKQENLTEFTMEIDGNTITGKFVPNTFYDIKMAANVYEYGFSFQEVP